MVDYKTIKHFPYVNVCMYYLNSRGLQCNDPLKPLLYKTEPIYSIYAIIGYASSFTSSP